MKVGTLLAALLVLPVSVAAAASCPGCVQAGAASVRLAVVPGAPLAGYGSLARRLLLPDLLGRRPHAFWLKPHEGELDPLAARALVLDDGPSRLVWITADLIAIDRAFTARVAARLAETGRRPTTLVISASHTHSGPGAFMASGLLGAAAVDALDEGVREPLVESLVEAVRRADAARRPALAGASGVTAPPLTTGRLGEPVDPEIVVVRIASPDGRAIALLWNYAIHGTMLGPRNLRLSGDVMGVASRELEAEVGAPALFVNGAVADVSPARHGHAEALAAGRRLAATVRAAWSGIDARETPRFSARTVRLPLPPARLPLRNCVGRWIPRALGLPLGAALPREAELMAAALGRTAWIVIPGELQSRLGRRIKDSARPRWDRAFVAGVSNEYLGYFLARADSERVTYVACASLYGPEAGEQVTAAAVELLRGLRRSGPGSAGKGDQP